MKMPWNPNRNKSRTIIELGTCVSQQGNRGDSKNHNCHHQPYFSITFIFLQNNKSCESPQFTVLIRFSLISKSKTKIHVKIITYNFINLNNLMQLSNLSSLIIILTILTSKRKSQAIFFFVMNRRKYY